MKNFILASRPKTLLAGIVPPTVTYVYFYFQYQRHELLYFGLCFIGALFIQLATNFFNDVIDHQKGADVKRVGPTRVSAAGLVDIKLVKKWAYSCVAVAAICGVPIILRGGWPFATLGLASLFLTYGYTGGKISLAYRGLGEIFVFLFFGLFSVIGSYYLYAQVVTLPVILISCMYGLLTTTFIGINNLRDRETDTEVGKKTMATRMSYGAYQKFILFTIFFPYVLCVIFRNFEMIYIMPIGFLPAIRLAKITLTKKGADLNEGLKFSGIHLIFFSILLSLVFSYGYRV